MQPQFVELPEIKVAGLGTRFISILAAQNNDMAVIPALWQKFVGQLAAIPNRASNTTTYGLVEYLPGGTAKVHPQELFYIACAPVLSFDGLPAGMIHRTVPAGKYAAFVHKGSLAGLGKTMAFIYQTWLPQSQVKLRQAPHLERYDERFNPHSDASEFNILLPIEAS